MSLFLNLHTWAAFLDFLSKILSTLKDDAYCSGLEKCAIPVTSFSLRVLGEWLQGGSGAENGVGVVSQVDGALAS